MNSKCSYSWLQYAPLLSVHSRRHRYIALQYGNQSLEYCQKRRNEMRKLDIIQHHNDLNTPLHATEENKSNNPKLNQKNVEQKVISKAWYQNTLWLHHRLLLHQSSDPTLCSNGELTSEREEDWNALISATTARKSRLHVSAVPPSVGIIIYAGFSLTSSIALKLLALWCWSERAFFNLKIIKRTEVWIPDPRLLRRDACYIWVSHFSPEGSVWSQSVLSYCNGLEQCFSNYSLRDLQIFCCFLMCSHLGCSKNLDYSACVKNLLILHVHVSVILLGFLKYLAIPGPVDALDRRCWAGKVAAECCSSHVGNLFGIRQNQSLCSEKINK